MRNRGITKREKGVGGLIDKTRRRGRSVYIRRGRERIGKGNNCNTNLA